MSTSNKDYDDDDNDDDDDDDDDDDVRRLSVAYIGPKSRTERPRKIKIGTEVAHVTRDSDTTFKRSKGQRSTCRGRGYIVAASRSVCFNKDVHVHLFICLSVQH